jgi:hypothetical protein
VSVATSDVVVAVFDREHLSTGLVAVHRAGLGPMARVLDPKRGALDDQLHRIGYQLPVRLAGADADLSLLLVTAPGRAERAVETLQRAGAQAVYLATRAGLPIDPAEGRPEAVVFDDHTSPPAASHDR